MSPVLQATRRRTKISGLKDSCRLEAELERNWYGYCSNRHSYLVESDGRELGSCFCSCWLLSYVDYPFLEHAEGGSPIEIRKEDNMMEARKSGP